MTVPSYSTVSRLIYILLLLASGRMVHDLSLLTIENGSFENKGNELVFWPKFGSKTAYSSYRQPGWQLKEASEVSIV